MAQPDPAIGLTMGMPSFSPGMIPPGMSVASYLRSLFFGNAPPMSASGGAPAPQPAAIPAPMAAAPAAQPMMPVPAPMPMPGAAPAQSALPAVSTPTQGTMVPIDAAQIPPPQLSDSLMNIAAILNPNLRGAQQQQYAMRMQRAQIGSLMQQPGMTMDKAIAIILNPELQKQIYGNPTQLGDVKIGPTQFPAFAQNGQVGYGIPGGQGGLSGLMQLGNEAARQQAAAEATGKTQGAAAATLPTALATADQTLQLIDSVANDPGKKWAIGSLGMVPPVPGTAQANFLAKLDQLKGQAFMAAFQGLRGAGARITNAEAMKASDAYARLQRAQSGPAFDQALSDMREMLVLARTRAGELAGGAPTPPPNAQPAQPAQSGLPSGWSVQVH